MPLGIKSRDYLLKHQRQGDFDVSYVVPGKYQEIQLFLFYEGGVEELIPCSKQRSVVWRVGGDGIGEGGWEQAQAHACSSQIQVMRYLLFHLP